MINFVFNIQSDDPFRFQLIQKRQKKKTNRIAFYDIYHVEEFKIPLSFTIAMLEFPSDHGHPSPTETTSGDTYAYSKLYCSGFFGNKIDELASTTKTFGILASIISISFFLNLLDAMKPI